MKSSFSLTLICVASLAQAQIVLSPSPAPAPGAPKADVKMIDPAKTEPAPGVTPATAKPEPLTQPEPKAPKNPTPKKPGDAEPTIIDADETHLNPKTNVHTFIGNVRVKSPKFTLTTDGKLDVKMKDAKKEENADKPPVPPAPGDAKGKADPKEAKAKAGAKADAKGPAPAVDPIALAKATPPVLPSDEKDKKAAKGAPAAKPDADPESDDVSNDIEWAVATGKLSTVRQIGPDGKIKEGVGRVVIYDANLKTLTIKEWPQVQSGKNRIIATDASTIMILDGENHLDVKGPATTKLEPDKDPNNPPASKNGPTPIAPKAPAPGAAAPVKPATTPAPAPR